MSGEYLTGDFDAFTARSPCALMGQGHGAALRTGVHAAGDVQSLQPAVEEPGDEAVTRVHGVHHLTGYDALPADLLAVIGHAAPAPPGGYHDAGPRCHRPPPTDTG